MSTSTLTDICSQAEKTVLKGQEVEVHMAKEDNNGENEDDGRGSRNLTSAKEDQQQPAKRKRQTVSYVCVDSSLTILV